MTLVFYRSLAPTEAATSNITVIDNNQTITTAQDTNITTITRTSEVNVTDTSATYGYTLTAQISANNLTGATVTIGSDTSSECSKATPCALSSAPTNILITNNNNATGAQGETTLFEVKITISANSNIGAYTLDIAYDETPIDPTIYTPFTANNGGQGTVVTDQNMIPIKYTGDTTNPIWAKADINNVGNDWFDYDNKKWANAVTVTTDTLDTYKNAPVGTVINESDILGYWTYIPRYEYQVCRPNASDSITLTAGQCQDGNGQDVLSTASPYLFNIQFQKSTQKTNYDGTTVGGWTTHPAFTFGTTELNGLWIGKFESSNPTTSRVTDATNIFIKPNQLGVSYNNVSAQFTMSVNLGKSGDGTVIPTNASQNTHNFNTFNTRLSKNDDWGVVAYLSTSIYGRGTSEVWINNCDDNSNNSSIGGDTYSDHTGWAGTSVSASRQSSGCSAYNGANATIDGAYHTTRGQHASTTDNVYGIYDLSGGNREYQMAVRNAAASSSGFSPFPDSKYYNNYPVPPFATKPTWSTSTSEEYYNNDACTYQYCGGQALHETKTVQSVSSDTQSWGSDYSYFVNSSYPWFLRGGTAGNGSDAGLFSSRRNNGNADSNHGFRVVGGGF
ncbi:MAG: hypothetical protein LBQ02_00255 [Candidatus Nomurabacteria bacterium]|nr:hypothetical protein [Candidatus Nomurabacteria bacterium]